jgi:SEC-C motif
MAWHECRPERWEAEQRIGRQLLEDCHTGIGDGGVAFLEGLFHVRSEHGHRYESVTLRVEYPPNFPERGVTPRVILLSHRERWQKGGDCHINSDWSLCLFVPGESGIDFGRADSLNALFAVLQTFLFKEHLYQQALVREAVTGQKAQWPGEARSHGMVGIAEAVRDKGRIGRNEPCPCGRGRKFKVCCMRRLRR